MKINIYGFIFLKEKEVMTSTDVTRVFQLKKINEEKEIDVGPTVIEMVHHRLGLWRLDLSLGLDMLHGMTRRRQVGSCGDMAA